jgi:alkylation response protein AidB-like acyl-CoA dehydrogenase
MDFGHGAFLSSPNAWTLQIESSTPDEICYVILRHIVNDGHRVLPEVVEESFRIHGRYGFSTEYEIEQLYREAPMLLIGEGTADIQRMIIGRRILDDYRI